ncbi:hypothetical protein LUW76_33700 [Actinomadura madurae]|uniref:hypothetical protein n=1 Tax=Actinomadura madurae TaxID=1993 RepID=UPI0020261060|nr:hypothetical protein [Actinomadura madurae]URM98889.1 hypothetical protein LUW76_33700 [Actinomadura madurae]URN09580.1 hypothetical protein LUW74_43700 [Actinomadura madurae]
MYEKIAYTLIIVLQGYAAGVGLAFSVETPSSTIAVIAAALFSALFADWSLMAAWARSHWADFSFDRKSLTCVLATILVGAAAFGTIEYYNQAKFWPEGPVIMGVLLAAAPFLAASAFLVVSLFRRLGCDDWLEMTAAAHGGWSLFLFVVSATCLVLSMANAVYEIPAILDNAILVQNMMTWVIVLVGFTAGMVVRLGVSMICHVAPLSIKLRYFYSAGAIIGGLVLFNLP